jgi:hypothetical protein
MACCCRIARGSHGSEPAREHIGSTPGWRSLHRKKFAAAKAGAGSFKRHTGGLVTPRMQHGCQCADRAGDHADRRRAVSAPMPDEGQPEARLFEYSASAPRPGLYLPRHRRRTRSPHRHRASALQCRCHSRHPQPWPSCGDRMTCGSREPLGWPATRMHRSARRGRCEGQCWSPRPMDRGQARGCRQH